MNILYIIVSVCVALGIEFNPQFFSAPLQFLADITLGFAMLYVFGVVTKESHNLRK